MSQVRDAQETYTHYTGDELGLWNVNTDNMYQPLSDLSASVVRIKIIVRHWDKISAALMNKHMQIRPRAYRGMYKEQK